MVVPTTYDHMLLLVTGSGAQFRQPMPRYALRALDLMLRSMYPRNQLTPILTEASPSHDIEA